MNDMSWTGGAAPSAADEEHDAPRRELKAGLAVAGLFFVGLLGAAAFVPLDAGAFAEGRVAVSGSRQAVQHREGGIVTGLNVVEGQRVKQGDPLLTVSTTDTLAAERGLAGEVIALLAHRARLLAERDGRGAVAEPVEFASLDADNRAIAQDALKGQRLLFNARRNALATERGVLNQRIRQHSEQIAGFHHQMASNQKQQRLIGEELDGLKSLVSEGFVAVNRVRAVERSAAELNGTHGAYRAEVARSTEAQGEARLQIASLDKQRIEEVASQLREVQVRLDELKPRWDASREQLARSTVRAPATGRVVGLKVHTVGGVVGPGELLMEVMPQNRALVIVAQAAPNDADDIRIGMETQVRFSAIQDRTLPVLHGRVTEISADSMEDERTGQRYMRMEVVVPPAELAVLRSVREDGLVAGLPAEVLVPLRKRTALTYLLEPLTGSLWRAGREQ